MGCDAIRVAADAVRSRLAGDWPAKWPTPLPSFRAPTWFDYRELQGVGVLEPQSLGELREHIATRLREDRAVLDELREHVRPLRSDTRGSATPQA